ncbi:hypothetical protein N7478_013350 [Penicillium angulare]|uniref:uncharacterized protein n=1 Tax=Penicillium angulare TaxID=116970 RepID=UPI00253FB6A6|nr:uncharacterized protein N7478_013350 [Penicillium angulare]KAJ5257246.1 hypothetical protein N7478_013350 [Penicillium angulare]
MSTSNRDLGSRQTCLASETSHHASRLHILPQGNHLLSLMTILRDSKTSVATFAEVTERVGDQLISAALDLLPIQETNVLSPTGVEYQGAREAVEVCGVSILRAGASLENSMRRGYTIEEQNLILHYKVVLSALGKFWFNETSQPVFLHYITPSSQLGSLRKVCDLDVRESQEKEHD